jgi:hypothetical protein
MSEEEKPKKRSITVTIEELEDEETVHVQVVPTYGRAGTMMEDLSLAFGHVLGTSVKELDGIPRVMELYGQMTMRTAMAVYEKQNGKQNTVREALESLFKMIRPAAMAIKDLPPELREKFNTKCQACTKLECPLCGKGLTPETEEVPECLH